MDIPKTTSKRSFLTRNPDGATSLYPLEKPVVKIGRVQDNDLVLLDPERSVSRWHAVVSTDGSGQIYINDQNSANGTLVNGVRISGPHRLSPNDVVRLGDHDLVLQEEPPEDQRFAIQAGSVEIGELQKESGLLRLASEESADVKNLELLYEVGVTLARSHSIEEVTAAAIGLLFKIEQVHRATVMIWEEKKRLSPAPNSTRATSAKSGPCRNLTTRARW